ncbi:zinc finger BED domain-containing protein RICESLEEPER 1-like [Corylus avellana]|uniref:zinc finger BED domain-containing protein RICESLEEPER 1-like n=1 Tax=Corylus avellana TaxID=13451 RepID=UPI00286B909B|nr:zinc finger BED domain-containing protein RICESLEEPER 1-like [Corylus avellana]
MEWGINILFSITVDNATNNDAMLKFMIKRLKNKHYSILGCKFLHVQCAAHILNLVVTEGLKGLGACVSTIRNVVKFVRSSPARMAKFKSCIELEKITCTKMVCLDVQTRWNSTYLMLSSVEKYEKVFALLEEDEGKHFVAPSSIEWETARLFVRFLKSFYDATLKFSSSKNVTSNSYFIQLCIIQNTLNDSICSDNPILSSMSFDMKTKYDKYWETVERINLLLYVAFVLGPRYKMKGLVFWLRRCNEADWAKFIEESVDALLNRLWDQYNLFHGEDGLSNSDVGIQSSTPTFSNVDDEDLEDQDVKYLKVFSQHQEETESEYKSEVERYLSDRCEAATQDFNILLWWKVNASKYPILAEVARDVLAIPISTVASESAFSNR